MHCKGCDREIEVKWVVHQGSKTPVLEDMCRVCLGWVETAKLPAIVPKYVFEGGVPCARRKPRTPPLIPGVEYGEEEI